MHAATQECNPLDLTTVSGSDLARMCNRCLALVPHRVEVRTATQRSIVCARCALELATSAEPVLKVLPVIREKISPFVCSDLSYRASDVDATAHQRTLDDSARRYAVRVAVIVAALTVEPMRGVA